MSILDIVVCILISLIFIALMAAVIVAVDAFEPENLEKYRKAYREVCSEKSGESRDTEELK